MAQRELALSQRLRTPRSAGVAGIIFSLLLGAALVLIRLAVPPTSDGEWLTDSGKRRFVQIALNLVPFAGIAFLWFIGVIRDRVGDREDRFFATAFLGSGLLFVAMLFVCAAVAGGLLSDPVGPTGTISSELWDIERRITLALMNIYAIRMGAVFILTTTTIGARTGTLPTWLTVGGYATAVILLFGVTLTPWVSLLMPLWAFVLSVDMLVKSRVFEPAREPV